MLEPVRGLLSHYPNLQEGLDGNTYTTWTAGAHSPDRSERVRLRI